MVNNPQNISCPIGRVYANLEGENIYEILTYLGLGSNIEPRVDYIKQAVNEIARIPQTRITGASSLYSTAPWGMTDQGEFINQVLQVKTSLPALGFLHHLQDIEIKMGRQHVEKWGPRIIDLDLLLYGDEVIDADELKVPHPYMRQRLFVLVPLAEIDAELVFPDDGTKIREVLIKVQTEKETQAIRRI